MSETSQRPSDDNKARMLIELGGLAVEFEHRAVAAGLSTEAERAKELKQLLRERLAEHWDESGKPVRRRGDGSR